MKLAECHPDKPHYCRGLCERCYNRTRYQENRESERERIGRNNYSQVLNGLGLTWEDYNALVQSQGNRCRICGGEAPKGKRLHLDHSHATGKVRGLLCSRCNHGIGLFRDNPVLCRLAAVYLESA